MSETYELTDLELTEVSFVPEGDDPLAKIAITKRKEENMTEQTEVQEEGKRPAYKALYEEEQSKVEALKGEVETLKKEIEDLKAAAVEKAKPAEEMIEVEGEMIAKSAIPAPILKKLEEVEKAAEQAAFEKKAEEVLPNFKGTVEERAALIKAIGGDENLLTVLKAADAAFAGLFEEIGKGKAVEFESPQEELNHMVKAYMDEHAVEKPAAMTEVTKSGRGRELLLKTMKKDTK